MKIVRVWKAIGGLSTIRPEETALQMWRWCSRVFAATADHSSRVEGRVTYADCVPRSERRDAGESGATRQRDPRQEPVPLTGGNGSRRLADGLYDAPTCYPLSTNRYVPPVEDLTTGEERSDPS